MTIDLNGRFLDFRSWWVVSKCNKTWKRHQEFFPNEMVFRCLLQPLVCCHLQLFCSWKCRPLRMCTALSILTLQYALQFRFWVLAHFECGVLRAVTLWCSQWCVHRIVLFTMGVFGKFLAFSWKYIRLTNKDRRNRHGTSLYDINCDGGCFVSALMFCHSVYASQSAFHKLIVLDSTTLWVSGCCVLALMIYLSLCLCTSVGWLTRVIY